MRKRGIYEKLFKRPIDVLLSFISLIILGPLFCFVAIMVRTKIGKPVIFKQERPGKNEKIFTLFKFRTMNEKKDSNGQLLSDDLRLTKFGKTLRSTSIDELPELINIIRGDMSIIGPRPLLVKYLERYNKDQKMRHQVLPGLTGLSQVSGRNQLSWDEKFDFDKKYIEKISFIGDIRIVFLTIYHIFRRTGISSETSSTNEEFIGKIGEEREV